MYDSIKCWNYHYLTSDLCGYVDLHWFISFSEEVM